MEPINRSITDLHPIMRRKVQVLEGKLLDRNLLATPGAAGFKLFEGYRSPDRQVEVFNQKTSKAKAWQSAHQYGLAVDYVWWDPEKGWSWEPNHDWDGLADCAEAVGLSAPIKWDRPHIEHPSWNTLRAAIRLRY